MPLIFEKNTALSGIELVTEVPPSNVEFYKRCMTYASFLLPLKVPAYDERHIDDKKHYTKSNVNVCYAAPRNKRKSRDWYETQLTVAKEITHIEGYPEKNVPFFVVTDDGYWFKAHTTSDGNKQFSAVGDELIMGRWLKGRLAAAGLVQQQTLDRVKADLDGFCICGENDARVFADNSLMLPTIVVLKKNARILKLWANIFNSTGFMRGNPLFIVDDEADAVSLNTLVNKNRQSSINKYLDSIRNGASSSLYLQVTGTPQSIFLQTRESGWHPLFTHYFKPGKSYLGGDFFFPKTGKPDCVTYLDNLQQPERDVVIRHLLVSAQILASGGITSTCLIHPSVKQAAHQRFADSINDELDWCKANLHGALETELRKQHTLLGPTKSAKVPFSEIMDKVTELLTNNEFKVLIMNGKTDVESSEYASGCNFVIGGNTLGRGVTFPGLQTIYYTRRMGWKAIMDSKYKIA